MYPYLKALHIIFFVTWFAGLFYTVRLFVYNTEAFKKAGQAQLTMVNQFNIMIRRLWLAITWPSCLLTLFFGGWLLTYYPVLPHWLLVKLIFVAALVTYHLSLHAIYLQQRRLVFRYSHRMLRIWNELPTVFLVVIVFLAVTKSANSAGVTLPAAVLLIALIFGFLRLSGKLKA